MTRIVLKIFLFIILVYSDSILSAPSHFLILKNYQADYTLKWLGLNVGSSHHTLVKNHPSSTYTVQSSSTPNLAFLPFKDIEESHFVFSNAAIVPYQYIFRTMDNKKNIEGSITFDWKSSKLIKQIKGQPSQEEPLKGKIYDKITHIFQLRQDLKLDKKDLIYTVVEPKKTKVYHYTLAGTETLKTPLGDLATVKVVHVSDNKERRTELWLAKDLDYLMVRLVQIRKGKKTAEANIKRLHK